VDRCDVSLVRIRGQKGPLIVMVSGPEAGLELLEICVADIDTQWCCLRLYHRGWCVPFGHQVFVF
jgi:hypothetical protein